MFVVSAGATLFVSEGGTAAMGHNSKAILWSEGRFRDGSTRVKEEGTCLLSILVLCLRGASSRGKFRMRGGVHLCLVGLGLEQGLRWLPYIHLEGLPNETFPHRDE